MKFAIPAIVAIFIVIVTMIFVLEPKESMIIDNQNFMKDGYRNMYIDHDNDNILKEIKKISGADRVAIYTYHNGTRSITGIPFIKESIKSEITTGRSYKKTHTNILINDNFHINDYLYKNIYLYIDRVNYNNSTIPLAIIDTLLSNDIKSYYARHIFSDDKISGYVVVEKTSGFMTLDRPHLDSVEVLIKNIEKNIAKMKREESDTMRSSVENSRLYIFVIMIIFVIVIIIYYGSHKINEVSTKTAEMINKSDVVRSEQLDLIGARLNKSLMDNHNFVKNRFVELVTIVNKINSRVNVVETSLSNEEPDH
jgi:hypothetical protein